MNTSIILRNILFQNRLAVQRITSRCHGPVLVQRCAPLLPRLVSTGAVTVKPSGLKDGIKTKIQLYIRKHKLRGSGYYLYEKVADHIDYRAFMQDLELPDTFNSWFLVTELHVWMLMARLMAEGEEGRNVRNSMVEALWTDATSRAKKLDTNNFSLVRNQISELNEAFQAALVIYDEGLLSDDRILAAALWRRLLNAECTDVTILEAVVKYTRQTISLLDHTDAEELYKKTPIPWVSISDILKDLR